MAFALFTPDDVREALKQVEDPELGVNIVDLGLVYDATVADNGDITITMTLTSMGCPLGPVITEQIRAALSGVYGLPGVGTIDVKLVWSPPWSPERMSEAAKDELGIW
ncbi:MAG TPA: metal-sulfur cluster assembly factor [Acidimicrobiales bacterium]|nr:metal-sulfur cluster assembly factor [Acidimicrobiales bacterium]